jgi:hypothetical protein
MVRRIILGISILAALAGADEVDRMINRLANRIAKGIDDPKIVVVWEIVPRQDDIVTNLGRHLKDKLFNELVGQMGGRAKDPLTGEKNIAQELNYRIKYPSPADLLARFHGDYSLTGRYVIHEETQELEIFLTVYDSLSPTARFSADDRVTLSEERFREFKKWDLERSPDLSSVELSDFLTDEGTGDDFIESASLVDTKLGTPIGRRMRTNEYFRINTKLKKDGYVYILGFDRPSQRFYLLFPGPSETQNNCLAGEFCFPAQMSFKTVPPAGENWFKVIVATRSVNWTDLVPEIMVEDEPLWIEQVKLKKFINNLNTKSGGWQAVLTEVWIEE